MAMPRQSLATGGGALSTSPFVAATGGQEGFRRRKEEGFSPSPVHLGGSSRIHSANAYRFPYAARYSVHRIFYPRDHGEEHCHDEEEQ